MALEASHDMQEFTIPELLDGWLRAMLALWETDVRDFDPGQTATPGKIHALFKANGWGGWNGGRYTENAKTYWCGHTMGATGQRIGAHLGEPGEQVVYPVGLDPQIALFCYPSTKRLASAAKWRAAGVPMPVLWRPGDDGKPMSTDGMVADDWSEVVIPGMTLTVKTSGKDPRNGDHIVCAQRIDGDDLHTVEGNGRGYFPDGTWGEGVVVRDERKPRAVADIRMAVQLTHDHIEDWSRHDEALA